MKLVALFMVIMEEEIIAKKEAEKLSEVEDFQFSDQEDLSADETCAPLSIDCNGRVVSDIEKFDGEGKDNCDMHFIDRAEFYKRRGSENRLYTSIEDLNVSDEEEQCYNALTLQTVSLDGIACVSSKQTMSSLATLNYSRVGFKDQHSSAEYASDDEMGSNTEEKCFVRDKYTKLNPGYTFADNDTSVKCDSSADFLRSRKTLNSLNVKNAFSKSLVLVEKNMPDLCDEPDSPPMTCLEFLKSEFIDDYETDAEDVSVGSANDINEKIRQNRSGFQSSCNEFNNIKFLNTSESENILHVQGAGILYTGDSRRSSAAGFLTEDETLNLENFSDVARKKLKKRNFFIVEKDEVSDDSLTDEEILDAKHAEWTETDDSGGVRQITQIKTETSIKLEDAVRSLKKVPKKEPSDERKSSTDSEQEDLGFSEKKSMFQRLSLTSDTLPKGNKWTQEVSLDDLPMAHGEIVQEHISFEDKFKMFEPDEGNRKRIQKRDKPDQPNVYKYDFTKSEEKPIPSEYVVSELEKAEEIVKQVNEELNIEDSLNDPHFDLSEQTRSRSEQDSAFTLERVEQEVSSLLAEVDKEEKELSIDLRRVSCSRTDSDKSSNINSRIFDMESEKGNGSSDFAALSPDIVQENLIPESHITYSEVNVTMQDGEKITVYETKSDTDRKSFDEEQCVELTTEIKAEGDDLGVEGDDIISRTTTTTTRIVTTVTTEGEQESQDDQNTGDGDDLRHSVEVILNQFMSSDSDAIKPEDSTVEHDE